MWGEIQSMTEILKPAIWFPFQKWGGSLIWLIPTVQDSRSWPLRQPTSNINTEKRLIRKVFTRTVRLCPLNTSFLSRRYFSKCHNSFCFAGLCTLGSFSIILSPLHHTTSHLSISHFLLASQSFLPELSHDLKKRNKLQFYDQKIVQLCHKLASTFMVTVGIYFGGTLGTPLQSLPKSGWVLSMDFCVFPHICELSTAQLK